MTSACWYISEIFVLDRHLEYNRNAEFIVFYAGPSVSPELIPGKVNGSHDPHMTWITQES